MTRPVPRQALGLLAVASALVFTLAWLVAQATEPGYQPASNDLSTLEATTAAHPWIMVGGDLTLAVGIAALAWALTTTVAGMDGHVAVGLLATAAAAVAVQALAREDCDTATADCITREQTGAVTWHHQLHGAASALAFLAVLGASLVLARPLREQWHQRGLATYSIATTAGGSIALLATILGPTPYSGLTERIFLSILIAWILILGLHLAQRIPAPNRATRPR